MSNRQNMHNPLARLSPLMGGLFLNLGRGLRHLLQPSRSLPIPALFELVSGLSQSGRGLSCTPVLSGLVTCFFSVFQSHPLSCTLVSSGLVRALSVLGGACAIHSGFCSFAPEFF